VDLLTGMFGQAIITRPFFVQVVLFVGFLITLSLSPQSFRPIG
jgi:hypothetical protein